MSATPAIHVGRERFHLAWDPAIPAIETVGDGDEVEFDLLDASNGLGASIKRKDDLQKMAESNKAFAHYRW